MRLYKMKKYIVKIFCQIMMFLFLIEITDAGALNVNAQTTMDYLAYTGVLESRQLLSANKKQPGENTIVAIIDTGVDLDHEALKNNLWINEKEKNGIKGIDDDNDGYIDDIYGYNFVENNGDVSDHNGHGTEMAGIIAMNGNSEKNKGIAYGASLMILKASEDGKFNTEAVRKALLYAMEHKADIINMSFGGTINPEELEDAVQKAAQRSILIAAASNGGYPTKSSLVPENVTMHDNYPAGFKDVIGVMSANSDRKLSSFSSWDSDPLYGATYNIVAPGEKIYTTGRNQRYTLSTGTSIATAFVSGAAAIWCSLNKENNFYDVKNIGKSFLESQGKKDIYGRWAGGIYLTPEYYTLNLNNMMKMALNKKFIFNIHEEVPTPVKSPGSLKFKKSDTRSYSTQDAKKTLGENGNYSKNKKILRPSRAKIKKIIIRKKKIIINYYAKNAYRYEIQYSVKRSFKKANKKIVKKRKYILKKNKKKKSYYIRIRAIAINGKKGKWSKIKKVDFFR